MVTVLLDVVAHPIFGRDQCARIATSSTARVAVDFLERGVQPGHRIGDRRHVMRQFGQLIARDSKVTEQGVGENLGQFVGTAR